MVCFATGFTDAEGCFSIKIQPNVKLKTKWRVRPVFSITLHLKDLSLLKAIQNTLKVGKINSGKKAIIYAVDSIKEIPFVLNHFDKYPLVTNKVSDYFLFKECFKIIKEGDHLTEKGLLKIINLKSNLNLGLTENLKYAFPNINFASPKTELIPSLNNRPDYFFKGIPDPFWVSGFISGDGSFHIVLTNSSEACEAGDKTKKERVFVRLGVHLHIRELEVLKGLATYLSENKKITILKKSVSLQISNFSNITNIILPFFDKYPILGMKSLDYQDFKKYV